MPSPRSAWSRPSVSGRVRSGTLSPSRIGPPAYRIAHVLHVGHGRRAAVPQPVDAAAEPDRVALARRQDVLPVDPDRRGAEEPLPLGLLVAQDLDDLDRLGIQPLLAQHLLQLLERLRMGGAALPPQELNPHLPPPSRSGPARRACPAPRSRRPRSRPPSPSRRRRGRTPCACRPARAPPRS